MNCPRPEELSLYAENELGAAFSSDLKSHLVSCAACRASLEDRKAFAAALEDLPDIEIPPDFTARIMARVFPERRPALAGLVAVVGSISGLFLGGLAYILLSGQSVPGLTISAGKSLWNSGRDGILTLARIGKLALLALKLMAQFAGDLMEKLGRAGSFIDPKVYAVLLVLFLAVSALVFLSIKRRTLNGEKS